MNENTLLEREILGILADLEEVDQKNGSTGITTSRNLYPGRMGEDSLDCLHHTLNQLQQQGKITFEDGYENIRLTR